MVALLSRGGCGGRLTWERSPACNQDSRGNARPS